MLYGDYIDLHEPPARRAEPECRRSVEGQGTGVSTGKPLPARSSVRHSVASVIVNRDHWALGLSVIGNTVAGGLFLGALLLAPQVLSRLLELL